MVKLKYKNKILKTIQKSLPGCKVFLYGSRATGKETWASDIDIALDNKKPIKQKILGIIIEEIENLNIPLKIDIVDLQNISNDFLQKIKENWIPWNV